MKGLQGPFVVALTAFGVLTASPQKTQSPNTAGEIYKKASPAVVLIETYNDKGEVAAAGSGFLVSADGRILTNYHVVAHTKRATVRLGNKDAYDEVDVLDIDKRKDIALIKIKAVDLPFLSLGKSSGVDVGDPVFSLSTPLGVLQNTLSDGIVSGIRAGDGYRYFQVTAPISHGSSGGPIFNVKGEVIGIAAATLAEGQNLNFAVPIDYAKGMLSSPSAPRSLAAIYEPEPEPEKASTPATATAASPTSAVLDPVKREIADVGIVSFLERKLGTWREDDARTLLGDPHGHRLGVGDPIPDIYAYDDPTKAFKQIELLFNAKTHKLNNVFVYPWNMTWDQCKNLWGNDVRTTRNANGTRYYAYKHRNLGVLTNSSGGVISIGVFSPDAPQ
jgi:S1-C subfamily serine protease